MEYSTVVATILVKFNLGLSNGQLNVDVFQFQGPC